MPIPRITKEDLKARLDADGPRPVLIDVRLKYPYEHSTIKLPGALRVAPPEFDCSTLPPEGEIVAYDSDPKELVSAQVVARLIRQGRQAAALKGGIAEWLTAKFPTEEKAAPKQKPPTAGALKG